MKNRFVVRVWFVEGSFSYPIPLRTFKEFYTECAKLIYKCILIAGSPKVI